MLLIQSTGPFLSDRKRARSRGVALLIVLALLVLITGLVVAFFSTATNELASAKNYAGGSSSQQLADAATQLAIGTIRKATSDTSTSPSGTDVAWASQPGMIRTWDSNGNARKVYKLFSASNLEATPPYDPSAGDLDSDFDKKPALFTDLNAPVADPAGASHYPIMDPFCAASKSSGDVPKIAGFYLTNPPTAVAVPNTAPMPVRWMYVLQDGKLIVPDLGSDGKTAEFKGATLPTKENPIVGRIAYWTDDETSKVNINTASEGVYWDLPRLMSLEDTGRWSGSGPLVVTPGLALTQPALGEYQRYPGHPATTSLSPILGNQVVGSLDVPKPDVPLTSSNIRNFKTYYDLLPRVQQGGSYSGTRIPNPNPASLSSSNTGRIDPDPDRLFASVDEFMFMQPSATASGSRQVLTGVNQPDFKAALERSRFFLTAHSSAPEVTMFNTPRVSMWPVWDDVTKRTVLDKTLAFCGNLTVLAGGVSADSPYYFTRQNSRSMTDDYSRSLRNQQLYAYLNRMMTTPVPGFGGSFNDVTALGTDQPQVLTSIYDYIRCINLYDSSSEGGVKAFPYTKLIHMSQSDTQDHWGGGEILPIKINNTQGFGRFATVSGIDLIFGPADTTPGDTSSAPNVKLVQVMLVPTFFSPMQGLPGMYPRLKYTISATSGFTLDSQPIFQTGGGINGTAWITNAPVQEAEGRGLGGMISPRASLERFGEFVSPMYKGMSPGGSVMPSNPPSTGNGFTVGNGFGSGAYPFVSKNTYSVGTSYLNTPTLAVGNPQFPNLVTSTMNFVGGELTVTLIAQDTNEVLQKLTIDIPSDQHLPKPAFVTGSNGKIIPGNQIFVGNTYTPDRNQGSPAMVLPTDVVRGVEIAGVGDVPTDTARSTNTTAGDVRMTAALPIVGPQYFHAQYDWSSPDPAPSATDNRQASGLEDDDGINRNFQINPMKLTYTPGTSDSAGRHGALAKGMHPRGPVAPAYARRSPYVPSRTLTSNLLGVTRTNGDGSALGDWDNGFALLPDGAYLNMGDIGDQEYVDSVNNNFANDSGKPRYPYVEKEDHFNSDHGAGSYFSPNRQVPSSMVLGSIPTGVQRFRPWQTLLFNPKPEDPNHPGRGLRGQTPPDHLIADLFWMPVVSPYPISQPFSTSGKTNLNYQIEPFNYIERSTGIYALMKASKMMAMPTSIYGKAGDSSVNDPRPFLGTVEELNGYPKVPGTFRFPINVRETLKGFEKVFAANDIFRSASQISEINLVPDDGSATYDNMASFWLNNTLTGDNLREKPYVDLYPRLTTKSNSYTVHFRVQVLQKLPSTAVDKWVEGKDQVSSEYRGSSEIERYLDSSDPKLPDYAVLMASRPDDAALNLDNHYRYRIVSTKRFSPY